MELDPPGSASDSCQRRSETSPSTSGVKGSYGSGVGAPRRDRRRQQRGGPGIRTGALARARSRASRRPSYAKPTRWATRHEASLPMSASHSTFGAPRSIAHRQAAWRRRPPRCRAPGPRARPSSRAPGTAGPGPTARPRRRVTPAVAESTTAQDATRPVGPLLAAVRTVTSTRRRSSGTGYGHGIGTHRADLAGPDRSGGRRRRRRAPPRAEHAGHRRRAASTGCDRIGHARRALPAPIVGCTRVPASPPRSWAALHALPVCSRRQRDALPPRMGGLPGHSRRPAEPPICRGAFPSMVLDKLLRAGEGRLLRKLKGLADQV